jgi:hypothetical protein
MSACKKFVSCAPLKIYATLFCSGKMYLLSGATVPQMNMKVSKIDTSYGIRAHYCLYRFYNVRYFAQC